MKKIILLLFLSGCCGVSGTWAQNTGIPELNDLIVTTAGASIPCKILLADDQAVTFTVYREDTGYFDMRLDRKYIQSIQVGYFKGDSPVPQQREIIAEEPPYYEEYDAFPRPVRRRDPGFRLHVNFGYSALIEGEDMGDYIENQEVSSGYNFGVSPTYVFDQQQFALGLAFDFRSHNIDRWKVNTTFVGPLFVVNFPMNRNNDYGFLDFALGYVNHNQSNGGQYSKADTFGARVSLGYVVYLGDGAGLEFRLGMLGASYKRATTNIPNVTTHFSNPQSISSIQLSVGFVFGR